ncbi:hypothetical protein BurJ1DRAFT_0716 [Burkholderiales bacterium JOSHI_001]|nr:hypothetical protein BurJ1DRAFT_0716 [Burkholderiales bacterium JOSHI_001]
MAAPVLKLQRHLWWLVLLVVGGAMGTAAFWSPDRQKRLVDEVAEGPMHGLAADAVRVLKLSDKTRQRTLRRDGSGWRSDAGPVDAAAVAGALRLLRHAVSERQFEREAPEFGLDTPALRVAVFTDAAAASPAFEFSFGAANPIGMANYVRVTTGAQAQTQLLPTYVAEAWLALLN